MRRRALRSWAAIGGWLALVELAPATMFHVEHLHPTPVRQHRAHLPALEQFADDHLVARQPVRQASFLDPDSATG